MSIKRNPIWNGREYAVASGYNYEGTHCGVPVWCQYDDAAEEMGYVEAKCPMMEPVLTLGAYFTQFCNMFRGPGDEFDFSFRIRPIPQ
jgi:hypothetical protein